MSARHHHRHLYRLYTTRSRRVFLCIVINARTNRERNWEKLMMRKSNESIPRWEHLEIEFLFLSSFMQNNSLSSPRGVKKERKNNEKKPRETRRWKHHSLSLSSYLTSLVVFINNTPQFKDDFTFVLLLFCVKFFFLTSRRRELAKRKKTLNTLEWEAKDPMFHALKVEIPAQRHKTENTHTTWGWVYYIYLILSYSHTNDILLDEFEGFDAMVPSRDDFVARFHLWIFSLGRDDRENTFSTTRLRSREHRCEVSRDTNWP
jgi:hypothetical protein